MPVWVGVVIAAGLGASAGHRLSGRLSARQALPVTNYRGLTVAGAGGIAVSVSALLVLGVLSLVARAAGDSFPPGMSGAAAVVAAALTGFGLLGFWDDVAADEEPRGWAAHLRALARGEPTGGALKLGVGAALGIVIAASLDPGLWGTIVRGALIAMSANLINLLDLRPGRAGKYGLLFGGGLLAAAVLIAPAFAAPLAAVAGAVAAFLPFDLQERALLGDAGANAVGAALGVVAVVVSPAPVEAAILIVLVWLHVLADRPGLSRMIEAVPALRRFDRLGRP